MPERQHTEHAPKRHSRGGKDHGAGELIREGRVSVAMKNAAPGGNPIAVAAGALVLGKIVDVGVPASSILGGLADLIGKLTADGAAPQVNSWIGPGANQPIEPGQLRSALGQNVLNELSQRTGMSQQELLNQLAAALPQLINRLMPHGRTPTLVDLEKDESADSLARLPAAVERTRGATYLEDVSNLLGGRKVLRAPVESDLEAHDLLSRGLPRAAVTALVENLHVIHVNEASEALGVSVRTLQRHKDTPAVLLDAQQSGRAWKFAAILAKATRVLGSQDEAEQWLKRPAIGLDRQRPVDLLTTPAGAKLVETYLGRLENGVYT